MPTNNGRRRGVSPDIRESRLNRRVAIVAIVASATTAIAAALITAHSAPVIRILGGPSVETSNTSSTGNSATPQTASDGTALPGGPALSRGNFTISTSGIDLDRNPPEAGNLTTGSIEVTDGTPEGLNFQYTKEVAIWHKTNLPSQADCHALEESDGQTAPVVDLTDIQQTGGLEKVCILTSEGRDAFMIVSGRQVQSNMPIPARAIVWSQILPVH